MPLFSPPADAIAMTPPAPPRCRIFIVYAFATISPFSLMPDSDIFMLSLALIDAFR
jgi:hypothetical protein